MKLYKYGMRLRPFGIGCQPKGVFKYEDSTKYETGNWSIIWYEKKLTEEECNNYDLDYLEEEEI